MKRGTLLALAAGLLLATASHVSAWWGNNWGWNPYNPWDPRYWIEEFFGGGYYGRGPWGWGGGPWGYGYPYYGGWGHPYYRGWGYPYHGGWGYPYHAGWGYAPYAVVPAQAASEKAEK